MLSKREAFFRDFLNHYNSWFSNDLATIAEKQIEGDLLEFRELGRGIEVEFSARIVAL